MVEESVDSLINDWITLRGKLKSYSIIHGIIHKHPENDKVLLAMILIEKRLENHYHIQDPLTILQSAGKLNRE